MYYIAICDDDIHFISYMKTMLTKAGVSENSCTYFEFQSGKEFIHAFDDISCIDLLILDIQMPELDGNEIAKQFRLHFPDSILVFCSGIYQPTVKSFEPNPFRYLLKSYTNPKMVTELKIILHEVEAKKAEPVILGSWYHYSVLFKPADILYISNNRNARSRLYIHPKSKYFSTEQKMASRQKLNTLYQILKDYGFAYAHNSYIVNLRYIKRISPTELELTDGTLLSISRSKEKGLRTALAAYVSKKYE
ncbi:MAG: LytTR family DNA-binding domain-containing protein [Clostridium sp.]|nr:LytTR family DNA-binding domain-containing protein [Clostridium sp.]MCM1172044.1 LytTR family DNA-binding domain-containing protein [Clostridium sp.]MCM1209045.1 LytTR family DNA-binding domain-containing protein [Ruminococcus sp.]